MTNEEKLNQIIEANAIVEKLRATASGDLSLKNSAIDAAGLYVKTLKRIDLNNVKTTEEMIEIDEFLKELKNNYLIKVEELSF